MNYQGHSLNSLVANSRLIIIRIFSCALQHSPYMGWVLTGLIYSSYSFCDHHGWFPPQLFFIIILYNYFINIFKCFHHFKHIIVLLKIRDLKYGEIVNPSDILNGIHEIYYVWNQSDDETGPDKIRRKSYRIFLTDNDIRLIISRK